MTDIEHKNQNKHFCLSSGKFRLDGGAMFGIIPKPLWNKVAPSDENNAIDLDLRLWLIKTSTKNILVDTGIGNYHGVKFEKRFDVRQDNSPIHTILENSKLTPADITDLVISHLHFDHVGGLVHRIGDELVETLPNAKIHLHKDHYKYAQNPSMRDAGSFHNKIFNPVIDRAIENRTIYWLEGKGDKILDLDNGETLNFITSDGHTPSMIHPYTKDLIYLADIVPTSAHIHIPWVMAYDINPVVSTEDKSRVLKFVYDNDKTIIFEHDPKYWGATIKLNEKGQYIADKLFKKSSNGIESII